MQPLGAGPRTRPIKDPEARDTPETERNEDRENSGLEGKDVVLDAAALFLGEAFDLGGLHDGLRAPDPREAHADEDAGQRQEDRLGGIRE